MERGWRNRKIGKLGKPDFKKSTARATNSELYAGNCTEGSMSFNRNLAIRKKVAQHPNFTSHRPSPMGKKRMPLQQAAAGEKKEVNVEEVDRIPRPHLNLVEFKLVGGIIGGGPVSGLCFLQIIFFFWLLSAQFSGACTVRPSEREVQNTQRSTFTPVFLSHTSVVRQ